MKSVSFDWTEKFREYGDPISKEEAHEMIFTERSGFREEENKKGKGEDVF